MRGAKIRTRRELLRDASAAGAWLGAGALAVACAPAAAPATPLPSPVATPLPPPETTKIRIGTTPPPTCEAPSWLVLDLLREEGFTDVAYGGALLAGAADVGYLYGNYLVSGIEAGLPFTAVAGIHTGCIELWAAPGISSIRDLKGKTMDVWDKLQGPGTQKATGQFYGFLVSALAQIGMDPSALNLNEVSPDADTDERFLVGQTDAVFEAVHFGPLMRRNPRRRGQVILDTSVDRPWSQYYCCMLTAHRDWARSNPVATKRMTRAFLRASDLVTKNKAGAVQKAVGGGIYAKNTALNAEILGETIGMLSYEWREFDPEETMRFFAQRLRDVGLVKKPPQQLVDEGSSFAYMRQLMKELKP